MNKFNPNNPEDLDKLEQEQSRVQSQLESLTHYKEFPALQQALESKLQALLDNYILDVRLRPVDTDRLYYIYGRLEMPKIT